jgi:hypothetical protein
MCVDRAPMELAADPDLVELARAGGHRAALVSSIDTVRDVEVALIEGPSAWDRLRTWRGAGVRAGVIVRTDEAPPPDRPALEPVVLLRKSAPDALATAISRLGGARSPGATLLAGGRFEQGLFVPRGGEPVALTDIETRLLAYLAARPGRPVDREELQEQVWDHKQALATKAVDQAVLRLRKKIEPDPAHPTTLLTVRHGGYRVGTAPAPVLPSVDPGPFVGREGVVGELVDRLMSARVLVALVGPPGVGKSRVARQVLAELGARGVAARSVDLDTVPAGVDPAVALATALDLDLPATGDGLASLAAALADGVLVVDHAEQRPEVVSALLRVARDRWPVLLASQVVPAGELVEVRLLPPLEEEAAVELLLFRTAGALSAPQAHQVASLLDRLPLALVLAASRIALLGIDGFLEAADQHLALLSPSEADRHGSLLTAVRDTLARLAPSQQAALRALTVFRSPFGLSDARAILGDGVALTVSELVARGVLTRDGPRYRVLHLIRDRLLAEEGLSAEVGARHLQWAQARVAELRPRLRGFEALETFSELARLHADLQAAFDQAVAQGEVQAALLVGEGLDAVLSYTGTLEERRVLLARLQGLRSEEPEILARLAWLEMKLVQGVDRPQTLLLAKKVALELAHSDPFTATRATCNVVHLLLDSQPAQALEALLVCQPPRALLGRVRGMEILCREGLGEISLLDATHALGAQVDDLIAQGALWDACYMGLHYASHLEANAPHHHRRFLEQLCAWVQGLRDPRLGALTRLALAARYRVEGEVTEARRLFAEADALFARFQPTSRVEVLYAAARVDLEAGDLSPAREGYERVVEDAARRGRHQLETVSATRLAALEVEAGRLVAALGWAQRSVAVASRLGHPHFLAYARLMQAIVELLSGDPAAAQQSWRQSDPGALTGLTPLLWRAVGVVVSARLGAPEPGLDEPMDTLAAEALSPAAPELRALLAAGRAGQRERLVQGTEPSVVRGLEVRLFARVWLALPA